ncbi:MAG TPA: EthD family reductase [Streptosporangiaceae bacterium]|jgi:uncharacterized protein (TIGR02118 family)
MVRFLVTYDRPADPEAFERHYRQVHLPLTRKLPGLLRYTISRDVTAVRGEPYDLVTELGWADMAALRAAFGSPPGQDTAADVGNLAGDGAVRRMIFQGAGA